jgi:dihydropteroate synthase
VTQAPRAASRRRAKSKDRIFRRDRITLVGVLNLTPDSFSDGGRFVRTTAQGEALALSEFLRCAEALLEAGAHVLDIGGESTRPGAALVPADVEIARTVPAIEALASRFDAPISIDTRKSAVARAALEVGASVVNDVSGLRFDPEIAQVVAATDALLILGHMRGTPETMQAEAHYVDVLGEVASELDASLALARRAGIPDTRLAVDPGIGFAKGLAENLELLAHLGWLRERLGLPLLVGPSRKSFLGRITGDDVAERASATLAACAVAAFTGADGLRVHDPADAARAAAVGRAIRGARRKELT